MGGKKGITLIELILACTLGAIVIAASVMAIVSLSVMQGKVNRGIHNDLEWVAADAHMKASVKNAAYVTIINTGTGLELYNAASNLIGTYANSGTDLTYTPAGIGASVTVFRSVNSAFASINTVNTKTKEVRVTFSQPFASVLNLICGLDLKNSSWALIIQGDPARIDNGTLVPNQIIQTSDLGYLIMGTANYSGGAGGAGHRPYLIKLKSDLTRAWSNVYTYNMAIIGQMTGIWLNNAYLSSPRSSILLETFDKRSGGTSTGFICTFGRYVLMFNPDGSCKGVANFGNSITIAAIKQIFDGNGNASTDGFVGVGTYTSGHKYAYICTFNENGTAGASITRGQYYDVSGEYSEGYAVAQSFSNTGDYDGFIIGGRKYSQNTPTTQDNWILKVTKDKGMLRSSWQWIARSSYGSQTCISYLTNLYKNDGTPDGFVVGAHINSANNSNINCIVRFSDYTGTAFSQQKGLTNAAFFANAWQRSDGFMVSSLSSTNVPQLTRLAPDLTIGTVIDGPNPASSAPYTRTSSYDQGFQLATIENDGYVFLGNYFQSTVGSEPVYIVILKTDLTGNCPGADHPKILIDNPATPTIQPGSVFAAANDNTASAPQNVDW